MDIRTKRWQKSACSLALAAAMVLPSIGAAFAAGDTLPPREGEQGYIGEHQPSAHGYNRANILNWSPDSDEFSDFMRAKVPLQERNEAFRPTQANPLLDQEVQALTLAGDYGIGFFDSFQYNDQFAQYLFNFWQYLDYYGSWHGMATNPQSHDLFTPGDPNGNGKFEFGVVNLPNPAYTNAAHKNGVQSLGCIFFPRPEHTQDFVYKDENGRFPIADKLVEIANYYGFDGYFVNAEEDLKPEEMPLYEEFCRAITSQGVYIQAYASCLYGPDNQSKWGTMDYGDKNAGSFSNWLKQPGSDRAASSLYMNPDPTKKQVEDSVSSMEALGLDPKKVVFQTLEAGQTGFSGMRGTLFNTLDENLVPQTGLGFLGTDTVRNHLDEQVFGHVGKNSYRYNKRNDPEYQKYVFARERTWWSGSLDQPYYQPTKTQQPDDYFPEELCNDILNATTDPYQTANNPNRGQANEGKEYQSWPGLAAFISERSVIDGSNFYTNFNTGHGMEYYVDGEVSNPREWSNINIQDILPTWQWWIETTGSRLNVDFDYGQQYNPAFELTQVGGYNGGSSLVVKGDLDAENFLRLYKSKLDIKEGSQLGLVYNKPSQTDSSTLKVGLIFEDKPELVEYVTVENANRQTDGWEETALDLSAYAGRTLAGFGLAFDTQDKIEDYQINIGEISISDGAVKAPEAPTGLKINKSYETSETCISWDLDDYDSVQRYNVYLQDQDGKLTYLGGTYDDVYYIKDLYDPKGMVTIKVAAVGLDGTEGPAAEVQRNPGQEIQDVKVSEGAGTLEVSWNNPDTAYDSIRLDVSFDYGHEEVYSKTVSRDTRKTTVEVPIADGSNYNVRLSLLDEQGNVIAETDHTGQLNDYYCGEYDGDIVFSNNILSFTPPGVNDWSRFYAYYKGKPVTFRSGNVGAIRGYDDMRGLYITDDSGVMDVVLEDYAGNRSKAVKIPFHKDGMTCAALDETVFPDPALLTAVKALATTPEELKNITSLDLSGSNLKDLSGLRYLRNLETLNLSNCTSLEAIRENALSLNVKLHEVNITGCSNLKVASFADTTLETIVCEDVSALTNLLSLDLSNSRFDLTEGTPEQVLAHAVAAQAEGKDDFTIPSATKENLAYKMTATGNFSGTWYLFDGRTDNAMQVAWINNLPAYVDVKFDAPTRIESYNVYVANNDPSLGFKDFRLQVSDDGTTWSDVSVVTGHTGENVSVTIEEPQSATYYRFQIDGKIPEKTPAKFAELELMGYKDVVYSPGVTLGYQRPEAYDKAMPEVLRFNKKAGASFNLLDTMEDSVSVRGTDLAALLGADFIDPDYDLENAFANPVQTIRVTGDNGSSLTNEISLNQDGVYTAEYITFEDAGYQGRMVYTQTIYVRGVTAVLEQVIAAAEELLTNGALDNTMEAVVTEFHAALKDAKDIVAKDGATQQEINDATIRLLSVMAKVDWKQGDKTVLQVAVDVAREINKNLDLYLEPGKQAFVDALSAAEEILASANAWDDDIQAATDALVQAMAKLQMAPNKDILNEMIDKASTMDLSVYTTESADVLRTAIGNAQQVAADRNATQEQVNAAINSLQAALNGLTFMEDGKNPPESSDGDGSQNNGTTTPVGEGSAPTKTGDADFAGIAALAVLSMAGLILFRKRR